jgi:hypothetical protein
MSSSTLLTIKFSDDTALASVFVCSDSNPESLLPALDIIFEKIYLSQRHSEEMGRGRLNWEYIGTEILQYILNEFNTKMVPDNLLEAYKNDSIYILEIKPMPAENYGDVTNSLKSVVNINYKYASDNNSTIFNNTASELSSYVDMKFHVKNNLELILARCNLNKNEQLNILADLMVELLPYGKNSTRTFDSTDFGTLTAINNIDKN